MNTKKGRGKMGDGTGGSIFDSRYFPAGIALAAAVLVVAAFQFIEIFPDMSHLDARIYSGVKTGNYFRTAEKAAARAAGERGRIRNISTAGSIDNIARLAADHGRGSFALVQDGLPWSREMELVARLTMPETVFFLGPRAGAVTSIGDMAGLRIGIGPRGSGTAYLAESIFNTPRLKSMKVRLSNHTADEQLALLKNGGLDLGIFVISEYSDFIEKALCDDGMQIAGFRQSESIARRLPFLRSGFIRIGFYDPVKNIPPSDRQVLQVDTLLVSNGRARRSQVMGMLTVMSGIFPGLVAYNRNADNLTGLTISPAASDYFGNQGPEILDRYAPLLMDYIPVSGLVQLAMAVSVFFNILGLGNRFRLWRIDANRVALEGDMKEYFGDSVLPEEIETLRPLESHRTGAERERLESLIERFDRLVRRCRKQSQSMLVPMGAEMAYRYQEELAGKNLVMMKMYRQRLESTAS